MDDVTSNDRILRCIYCGEELDFPTTGDEHVYVPSLTEIIEDGLRDDS